LVRNGQNGFVVKTGDIEELAHAITTISENIKLRQQMAVRSREIIEGWNIDAATAGLMQALASVGVAFDNE
jgi:glycosyltransferase involved in cell wall biosynthesis